MDGWNSPFLGTVPGCKQSSGHLGPVEILRWVTWWACLDSSGGPWGPFLHSIGQASLPKSDLYILQSPLYLHTKYFHCRKQIPCVPSTHPSTPSAPRDSSESFFTGLFYCLHDFSFSRMASRWNDKLFSLFILASFTQWYALMFPLSLSYLGRSFLFSTA